MIPDNRILEISLICYSLVSTNFALLCRKLNKSGEFSYQFFTELCLDKLDKELINHFGKIPNDSEIELAKQYTKTISENLTRRLQ